MVCCVSGMDICAVDLYEGMSSTQGSRRGAVLAWLISGGNVLYR